MVKLYDCFMFSFEDDLLRLRLAEGSQYVEKFIIIESKKTHLGHNKNLRSEDMKTVFEKYKDQIIHHVIEDFPATIEEYPIGIVEDCKNKPDKQNFLNWLREHYQRSIICKYLSELDQSDICLVSDLDEIPNYQVITEDIKFNRNNVCNTVLKYRFVTYSTNIHYMWNANAHATFTSPIRLVNVNNISSLRFNFNDTIIDDRLNHYNMFRNPYDMIHKLNSLAESCSKSLEDGLNNKDLIKEYLIRIINGKLCGIATTTIDIEMTRIYLPRNIHILPRLFLLPPEEGEIYINRINTSDSDFEDIYKELSTPYSLHDLYRIPHFKPHIEKHFLIIPKNSETVFIRRDTNDKNQDFWIRAFSTWEEDKFAVFDKFLKTDKIFIDIGGWVGTTCIYGSKKSKHVFTVEADKFSFKYLEQNCADNATNITVINNVIFSKDDEDVVFGKNKFRENSSLNDSTSQIYFSEEVKPDDCYSIKSITFSTILERYSIVPTDISLVKVDIEGGEEYILEELVSVCRKYKIPLYVSFHYSWWTNKDLNRFIFLTEDEKNYILGYPFCSVLF